MLKFITIKLDISNACAFLSQRNWQNTFFAEICEKSSTLSLSFWPRLMCLHGQWPGLGNTLHCWYFPSLTRHYHCSVDRGHLPWVQSSIKTYKKEQNCDVCISPPEPRHFFHFVKEFQCNVLLMLLISYSSDLVWKQNCKTKYAAFFAEW